MSRLKLTLALIGFAIVVGFIFTLKPTPADAADFTLRLTPELNLEFGRRDYRYNSRNYRREYRRLERKHIRWCRNRYYSYERRNNTYRTYSGRVRFCRTVYLREMRRMQRNRHYR